MKRLLFWALPAALLSIAASCPPHPPNPIPTPTPPQPTPTPTVPPSGWTLRIEGNRFIPSLTGFIGCCNTPAADAAKGWTLPGDDEIRAYASATGGPMGLPKKMVTLRTGPFSDPGYGWNLLINPNGDSRVRAQCKTANAAGMGCNVDLVDHWALKNQNRTANLYYDNCEVTHSAPPARYQRWVREVVRQTGDLQNVIYNLGNEGWLCNPQQSWYDGLVNVVRVAESDFGMPRHPIGSTWKLGEVPHKSQTPLIYDYVEVHGDITSGYIQVDVGVPVLLTESENNSPPETPEQWISYLNSANGTNGQFNVMVWRGGMADVNWATLFQRLGGTAPPPVPPAPRHDSACVWSREGYGWQAVAGGISDAEAQRHADAVEKVIVYAPWLFRNGGNNLVCDGVPDDQNVRVDFFSILSAYLQPGCSIAGAPDNPYPYNEVDNIEVFATEDPCQTSGQSAGIHTIIFGSPGNYCTVRRGITGARQGFKGRSNWTTNPPAPCTGGPGPTPTPTPTPGPTPTPSPTPQPTPTPPTQSCGDMGGDLCEQSGACPSTHTALGQSWDCNPCCKTNPPPADACGEPTPPGLGRWGATIHTRGPNWTTLDSTPLVGPNATFCAEIGFTDGRRYCPPRQEGDPTRGACEAWSIADHKDAQGNTKPKWFFNQNLVVKGADPDLVIPENELQMLVRRGRGGIAKVCTPDLTICSNEVTVAP